MRRLLGVVFAMAAACLSGCGSHGVTGVTANYPDLTGNWQIQSAAAPVAGTPSGILLLGALESSGATVSGTFRFSNLAKPQSCGLDQVVTVAGTVDANRNVTLTSGALPNGSVIKAQFVAGTLLTTEGAGTIEVSGMTCGVPSAAAIGIEIAPVTGTFSGALTPGTLTAPAAGTAGTVSMVLTQSATPGPDGQFPVAGTLSYAFGSCTGSAALSGDASGVGLLLSAVVPAGTLALPPVTLFGAVSPTGSQISAAVVTFAPGPCSAGLGTSSEFTGTLSRQ